MSSTALAQALFSLCCEYEAVANHPGARAESARALSTCLAVTIRHAEDPPLLLALVVRDLAEAAVRSRRKLGGDVARPTARRSCPPKNGLARRRLRDLPDKESG
jgi:hypothetical protein